MDWLSLLEICVLCCVVVNGYQTVIKALEVESSEFLAGSELKIPTF